jgi:hypothetical protein
MEAGYYNVALGRIADYADSQKFDDSCRLGLVANNSSATMAIIGRQESRLERSYYKALHELQRLRSKREADLALVSHSDPPSQDDAQVPPAPSRETNDIPSPPEPAITAIIPPPPIVNRPPLTDSSAAPSNL